MPMPRCQPEQIVTVLRQIEVAVANSLKRVTRPSFGGSRKEFQVIIYTRL